MSGTQFASVLKLVVKELKSSIQTVGSEDRLIQTRIPLLASCLHQANRETSKSAILSLHHDVK